MSGLLGLVSADDVASDEDFFREEDDTTRGLTLDSGHAFGMSPEHGSRKGDQFEEVQEHLDLDDLFYNEPSNEIMVTERFVDGDVPPKQPQSVFFKLELTTLYVSSSSPFELGNLVLDFLRDAGESKIRKVKRCKFSVNADVCKQGAACTTKIRFYDCGSHKLAIEFQRHSGDTVTFNDIFKQALEYLKSRSDLTANELLEQTPTSLLA